MAFLVAWWRAVGWGEKGEDETSEETRGQERCLTHGRTLYIIEVVSTYRHSMFDFHLETGSSSSARVNHMGRSGEAGV